MFEFITGHEALIKWILIGLFGLILAVLIFISYRFENREKKHSNPIKKMTTLSMLAGLSVVLYYFVKISIAVFLPFIPGFLDIHFSNVPIFIAGYMFGPISGSVVTIIRMLVKLPGTSTMGVGELADLLIGLITVLIASLIYHRRKDRKGALLASCSIIVTWTITAMIANWLIILPFYIHLYGFETVFGMLQVIPGITESNYMMMYMLYAVIPFNLIISSIVSLLTFLIYKRVSIIYAKA